MRIEAFHVKAAFRYIRHFSWALAEYLAYPLMMLAATPVLLKALGNGQYAQLMLVTTISSLGGLAGAGMGAATIRDVSLCKGRNDLWEAALSVKSTVAATMVISCLVSGVLFLVMWVWSSQVFPLIGDMDSLRLVAVAAVAVILLEQMDIVFAGAIRGLERYDVAAKVEILMKVLALFAITVTAFLTNDLRAVLLILVLFTFGRALCKAVAASRLLGVAHLMPVWDAERMKRAFDFGKWAWLQMCGGGLLPISDRILIGSVLGSDALVRYSICLQLAQQIHAIPAAGFGWMFPVMTRKIAENNGVIPSGSIAKCLGANFLFTFVVALPIIFLSETILDVWVGGDLAKSSWQVLTGLGFAFFLLSIAIAPNYLILAIGKVKTLAIVNMVAGIATFLTAVSLISSLGLDGAVLARCVYGMVIAANFIFLYCYIRRATRL